jgi:hypothetical protein
MGEFLNDSKIPLHEVWDEKKQVIYYVREILKSLIMQVKNAYFPFYEGYSFNNKQIEKKNVINIILT